MLDHVARYKFSYYVCMYVSMYVCMYVSCHVTIQMHADITVILLSLQASLAVIIVIHIIKEFSINYFAKKVYSITTKTCPPLLCTDAFHRQKVRGGGQNVHF